MRLCSCVFLFHFCISDGLTDVLDANDVNDAEDVDVLRGRLTSLIAGSLTCCGLNL